MGRCVPILLDGSEDGEVFCLDRLKVAVGDRDGATEVVRIAISSVSDLPELLVDHSLQHHLEGVPQEEQHRFVAGRAGGPVEQLHRQSQRVRARLLEQHRLATEPHRLRMTRCRAAPAYLGTWTQLGKSPILRRVCAYRASFRCHHRRDGNPLGLRRCFLMSEGGPRDTVVARPPRRSTSLNERDHNHRRAGQQPADF